jgi:hypothetical protein
VLRLDFALRGLGSPPNLNSRIVGKFFKEFFQFAMREKKWWLVPLVLIIVVVGLLLYFSSGSGISWALYPSK